MYYLEDKITSLPGIGPTRAKAFAGLGVVTLKDLLSFFPRRYEDRTNCVPIGMTNDGDTVCVSALVSETPRGARIRAGMDIVKFKAVDETGSVDITFFNQNWIKNSIEQGEEYIFYGKIQANGWHRSMANPVFEKPEQKERVTGRIVPVYRLCKGLNQKIVMKSVRMGLDACSEFMAELLPENVMGERQLSRCRYAYENIHFPADAEALNTARRRLVYEELFLLGCALGSLRGAKTGKTGRIISAPDMEEFYSGLPFRPTGAQLRAVKDALGDMTDGKAMNRLVQGDVGSGKTLVAAALIWAAYRNGYSSAFMAPTEILAEQHVKTMEKFLTPFGIRIVKLTGSMTVKEKQAARDALASGEPVLAVGTHALFSAGVEFANLGLVITDEQHRFGVGQRSALIEKGEAENGAAPHVLVMSATPIPRTLALIIYGDLDVSIIDEMPPGRQKVDTFAVNSGYRERLTGFIRKQAAGGHRTFVVCPMVEENPDSPVVAGLKSAEEHAKELARQLPDLRVGCVHGKMKQKDKDSLMSAFASGELDVLVSTTVVEVGVDVPEATLMVVENAERFGLSQLHQLRGRVGRGKAKSWCILVSDADNDEAKARLGIMCKTNDGFKISEEDLRLRGPGDFFGSRQHGLPEMHIADLGADTRLLEIAKADAERLLASDPELALPEHALLKKRVEDMLWENTTFN